jgi:hypothetical protein
VAVTYYGQGSGNIFDDLDTDLGLTSTSGSSSQTLAAAKVRAATDAAKLRFEQKKLADEQRANADALARATAARQAQGDYLRGQFQTGDPSAFGDIEAQNTASQNYINTQAKTLLERLAGAKETATGLTTTGFDNLKNYLGANVPQAYATAQDAVAPITTNALAQYMASRGVDQQPVQAAVDTANAGLASSAGNYNQLLNVLRAQEASGQQSRLSEEQMARALAGSNLESTYGAGRAGIESEQMSALNQLATQISNARLQAKAVQDARNQAVQDALATLVGQGYTIPPPEERTVVKTELIGSGASRVKRTTYSDGTTEDTPDPDASGGNPALTPEVLQALAARRGMAF